ncbi:MAG: hypothetical protein GC190_21835 [Alphaproteobacteria bacterium]|nr:hypothetical protein [Alphaproteobacteria bacterium]
MARGKRHKPTEELRQRVQTYAALGILQEDICRLIGINSITTLGKYYRAELDLGEVQATAKVAERVYNEAKNPKGNLAAAFFWLKTRGKGQWREKTVVELQGRNGGPIQSVDISVLKDMTDEELDALRKASDKLAALAGRDSGGTTPQG